MKITFDLLLKFILKRMFSWKPYKFGQMCYLRQDPLEAISVFFGPRALILFVWKLLEKYEKRHHFCAHPHWWSPWRHKKSKKGTSLRRI